MPEQTISKTDFRIYLECPLHFWAVSHAYEPATAPTAMDEFRRQQGQQVEALALEHLKEWTNHAYAHASLLWQQTYIHDLFLARTDALVHDENENCFDLYEIKSGSNVDKEDLYDIAFQAAVCRQTIPLRKLHLVHLNKDYRREGELDMDALFLIEDVSAAVEEILTSIEAEMLNARTVLEQENHTNLEHCRTPNNCPFPDLCHPDLPGHSIYEIPRLHRNRALQLEEMGIRDIHNIPADFMLSEKQSAYVDVVRANRPFIDRDVLRQKLSKVRYPLYFLDYETCNPALPLFNGYKPNQHIVFQFSLHILPSPQADVEHHQFLHSELSDPAPAMLEKLSHTIQPQGSIIVWNKGFECSRHHELAEMHPAYAAFLENVNSRVFDLMEIFSQGLYIHPDFHGSASIKKVLPVLVPELSYDEMEIAKGDEASIAWWQIANELVTEEEKTIMIANLLQYCQLDTQAMLKIWDIIKINI